MRLDIINAGGIVTGDGKTILENTSVIIENGIITDMPKVGYIAYNYDADRFIDAKGGLVIPGVINIHAHGCALGPFVPYAWKSPPRERWLFNLDTHLLEGTTTIVDTDGVHLPAEVEGANKLHPINIKAGTMHTPANMKTFDIIDCAGGGLTDLHRNFTIDEAVAQGAVLIGEIGSPSTTAGNFEKCFRLGKVISVVHSRALDKAVVANDEAAIRKVLDEAGLTLTIDEAKDLVMKTSIDPLQVCCDAIRETVKYVKKFDLPTLLHAEPGMKDAILDVAKEIGPKCISGHSQHSFTPEQAVQYGKELKRLGANVEIISADFFGARQVEPSTEPTFALLREGLVDAITTDYSGGYHEPILLVLQRAIEQKILTLPGAIKLATSNPARIVPKVAINKGLVEQGRVADLCIVDKDDISKVRHVIIFGRRVIEDGKIIV